MNICDILVFCLFLFFFFKQKTAYEMRISDWSSDVCSSDLRRLPGGDRKAFQPENAKRCPYEYTAPRPDPMYRHSGYGESLRYRIRSTTSYADRPGHLHWYLSKRPDLVPG